MKIAPVLLCGGSGTRLWPLSRKSYPKQFVELMGEQTLFQASALRLSGGNGDLTFENPLVITNSDFRFIVTEQLMAVGIDPSAILIEPEGRNTAPAVLAAALRLAQSDPDAHMLVVPSDHVVPDISAFHRCIKDALPAVARGDLVTFGITPDAPETGYGYLELAHRPEDIDGPIALTRFVEKPKRELAQSMLDQGNYLWNAGIFLFAVKDIIKAFEAHAPNLMTPVQASLDAAKVDLGFLRLAPEPWSQAEDISIDYAVMERASNLSVMPFSGYWSDLGGWDSVWRNSTQNEAGVALSGNATDLGCRNTLLRAEAETQEIVGIGLENIIAVAMNDAVLVADMSKAQEVKEAVTALKSKQAIQATSFPKDHRPWGWFESLVIGERFQVKRIHVHPGAALSLQSHHHRAEHWIVVKGTAKVTVDDTATLVSENQSIYVPLGAKHRLENPGKVPMVLIEVQTGSYLGEDDIIRYDDVYARGQGAKG